MNENGKKLNIPGLIGLADYVLQRVNNLALRRDLIKDYNDGLKSDEALETFAKNAGVSLEDFKKIIGRA